MYSLNKDNPSFFDKEKLHSEFIRQSSVCHGCRRCFNYCPAFPTLFKLTDSKGVKALTLDDLYDVASQCFHCNMCYVNCPFTPPNELNMDYPHLLEWAWLLMRGEKGIPLKDRLYEMMDFVGLAKPLAPTMINFLESEDAPKLTVAPRSLKQTFRAKRVENPVAKVVLFPTCLVDNFFVEVGKDMIDVYTRLGIEVEMGDFVCCGAPMLDAGDAVALKRNAERNYAKMKEYMERGYDVVSPVPTCTLMLTKEYQYVLDREGLKVYDAMEYLMKLKRDGKIKLDYKLPVSAFYHAPCHLKYLGVGYPGVQTMRMIKAKVELADKGCSGIDGGWGLRNYSVAKSVGSKMMEAFSQSRADVFVTECPLAGMQIEKASGKRPLHPIQLLKRAMESDNKS